MKCKHIKTDGSQCNSYAMKNNNYCWRHSPDIPDDVKLHSLKQGGKGGNRRLIINLPELKIENSGDLPPFLVETIRSVRAGLIDTRTGSVIGYLTSILLRSYELSNLEERIEKLESVQTSGYVDITNNNN